MIEPLTAAEARVLATLMEKARTVPDSYPMTLNAIVAGCNQKSSREPITNFSEPQVQEALDGLKRRSLAFTSRGSRTDRWEHNFQRALVVPEQSAVLLGLLMLRGPQTAAELLTRCERLAGPRELDDARQQLERLIQRGLAINLGRGAGQREDRYMHLLCGPVSADALAKNSNR